MCYLIWQKGIQVADRIKVAHKQTLKWGEYLGLSRWAQCNHKSSVILNGWRRQKRKLEWCHMQSPPPTAVAVMTEEGPWAEAGGQPLEAGKVREGILLQSLQENTQPSWHLDFSPVRPGTYRTARYNAFMLFSTTNFVVICYNSNRKLAQQVKLHRGLTEVWGAPIFRSPSLKEPVRISHSTEGHFV